MPRPRPANASASAPQPRAHTLEGTAHTHTPIVALAHALQVAISPDGKYIASCANDKTINTYRVISL